MTASETETTNGPERRYYQLVFIWLRDADKFRRYLELARPVVERYGGALERMLLPEAIHAEGMTRPDIINVVHYESREAFAALGQDPDFARVVHLRSESIDMAAVDGRPVGGTLTHRELDRRVYLVELACYGREGATGYHDYDAEAGPFMERHGWHLERALSPDSASGLSFAPDVVKVAYFDSREAQAAMQGDPAHHRIEKHLYPAAVARSIWVTARVHPATLAPSGA